MTLLWRQLGDSNTSGFFQTLLGASASLLAISVTLMALVPALIELVRDHNPDFFAGHMARRRVKASLSRLLGTIWAYGTTLVVCTVAVLAPAIHITQTYAPVAPLTLAAILVGGVSFLIGTMLLISASYALTKTAFATL